MRVLNVINLQIIRTIEPSSARLCHTYQNLQVGHQRNKRTESLEILTSRVILPCFRHCTAIIYLLSRMPSLSLCLYKLVCRLCVNSIGKLYPGGLEYVASK